MLKFMEGFGRDLRIMAERYPDLFTCYAAWMFFCAEIIHTCIVL